MKFDTANVDVGVVVALGGLDLHDLRRSRSCSCYDARRSTTVATGAARRSGIVHVRGWSDAGTGASRATRSCATSRSCRAAARTRTSPLPPPAAPSACSARVDFGAGDPVARLGAKVTATVGGTTVTLTYSATSGLWSVADHAPAAGRRRTGARRRMDWEETQGHDSRSGNTCKTGGGNKCTGSFGTRSSARSRPRTPARARSRSRQVLRERHDLGELLERCSSVQTSCTHNMVVRIGVTGSLGERVVGERPDRRPARRRRQPEPVAGLRSRPEQAQGRARHGLRADLRQEHRTPPVPARRAPCGRPRSRGRASPSRRAAAVNQVPAGMNQRILGLGQARRRCTAPNNWSQFPNLTPADPRIIQVFLTPFGVFYGSGSNDRPGHRLRDASTSPAGPVRARASTTPARATATTPCPTTTPATSSAISSSTSRPSARAVARQRATSAPSAPVLPS